MILKRLSLIVLALASVCFALPAAAQQTYAMSVSADYTGPFADVAPSSVSGVRALIDWWNATRGKELGVTVEPRIYDMRYDNAVVAKTWPSILSKDAPIMHLGFGTPDLVTLMKRLPGDKVPMLIGTAMVGLVWVPNGWHFSIRPTYSHEFSGLLSYLQQKKGSKLRIGAFSTQSKGGFVDQVKGVQKLAQMYPDRFEVVDIQWVDDSPVSVTNELSAQMKLKPDVTIVGGTTTQVIAVAKAEEELGVKLPIISSTHNGLTEVARGFDLKKLEGSYSVFSFSPDNQKDLPIHDIYEKYHTGAGSWGLITAQSAAQTILALRTLERAIKTVGKDKVTGEAMYNALLGGPFTEADLLGSLPEVKFDKTAPFPVGAVKVKAQVVKDGKIVTVTDTWIDTPQLDKW